VNSYDFPSGSALDSYRGEPWFVRDNLNLTAEALGQLQALKGTQAPYVEGEASRESRLDYVRERLRLLYVGITRAKRELIVTWNTGKREKDPKQPAVAFQALRAFWEAHLNGSVALGANREQTDASA
jgi:DNA helicase-2/ATP-dependent DNA helicase PcrA